MTRPDAALGTRPPSAELRAELSRPVPWMYEWRVGGTTTTLHHPELASVHTTRRDLIERPVRDALATAGPRARAIDLGCSEGWFCHRLLEWGAAEVVGVDLRPDTVRRATLLREHYGIPERRLRLVQGDAFDVSPSRLGRFDVVLLMGLVYHVEDPIGLVRRAAALTRGVCAIESQLTRQTEPVAFGYGATEALRSTPAAFAAHVEDDAVTPSASGAGVASLVPNRAALELAARVAGFARVEYAAPMAAHNPRYVAGDRAVLMAWSGPQGPASVAGRAAAAVIGGARAARRRLRR